MLTNTFIHIQGIGAITEHRLWESGIRDWDSIDRDLPIPVSPSRKYFLQKGVEESRRHLDMCSPAYFSQLLPANQCWRLFPEFRDSIAYLDIETTGLDRYFNRITTIALYDGAAAALAWATVSGTSLGDWQAPAKKTPSVLVWKGRSLGWASWKKPSALRLKPNSDAT